MIDMEQIQDFAEVLHETGQFVDDENFWSDKEELNRVRCKSCGSYLFIPDLDIHKNCFCDSDCEEDHKKKLEHSDQERYYRKRREESEEDRLRRLRRNAENSRYRYAQKAAKREAEETKKRGGLTFLQWVVKLESDRKRGYCTLCGKKLLKKEFSGRKKVHAKCYKEWKAIKDKQNYLKRKEKKNV